MTATNYMAKSCPLAKLADDGRQRLHSADNMSERRGDESAREEKWLVRKPTFLQPFLTWQLLKDS